MDNAFTIQDLNRLRFVGGSALDGKSRAGWTIDALELGKAREHLQLELTVMVRFGHGLSTFGSHMIRSKWVGGKNEFWHHIVISNRISIDRANHTLWHELIHCSQSEQWAKLTGNPVWEFHDKAYLNGVGYNEKFWERHANEVADQMIREGRLIIHE